MFPADPHLHALFNLPAAVDGHPHEQAHTLAVDGHKRITLKYPVFDVIGQETSSVIPRQPVCGLSQVVCAKGVEVRLRGYFMGKQGCPGDLNHGSNIVGNLHIVVFFHLFGHSHCHLTHHAKLFYIGDEGDHNLGNSLDVLFGDLTCGFYNSPNLHLGNFGIGNGKPASSVAKHGVEFTQRLVPRPEFLQGYTHLIGQRLEILLGFGKKLVQGRIKEPYGHRQAVHHLEDIDKVFPLHGKDLFEGFFSARRVVRQNHLTHRLDLFGIEEHMLGAHKSDPFSTKL